MVRSQSSPVPGGDSAGPMPIFSSAGLFGQTDLAAYSAAKGGVYGLMRTLALEGADLGIKVNAVAPFAYTPGTASAVSADQAEWLRTTAPPELVAAVVALLAHEDVPVTGPVLDAGGGRVGINFIAATPGYYDRDLTP